MQIRTLLFTALLIITLLGCKDEIDNITVVNKPNTSVVNDHYISNRPPLQPSSFIKLPVGSVKPDGWLKEVLIRQKNGLTGNLNKISPWLTKKDNAWLSKDGKGENGWEEVPYWLKGYANMGYILEDQQIIDEALIWIKGVLNSQRKNGNFGPVHLRKDGSQDFWGNMLMLYCLQSYYEYSEDERVIDLMTRYFRYQLNYPEKKFLTPYWQKIRAGDNLHSVLWLYNRTGDQFLLELANKIHRNCADWTSRNHRITDIKNHREIKTNEESLQWYTSQIDWHNVNHAQGFREPAQFYLLSGDKKLLNASYENFNIMREHFGQVPGGMYAGDINARPSFDDPRQPVETCGIVEQMNSDEHMLRITGDPFWADHLENVAFNTYPAATMPDMKSLRFLTAPNMIISDNKNYREPFDASGNSLLMSPLNHRCCQHNHSQAWPYFIENMWMATPDNGLAAVAYGACKVDVTVGNGHAISITETTNYPFEERLEFTISTSWSTYFPLYFRIPAWCASAQLKINGKTIDQQPVAGKYIRIERTWNNNDKVSIAFPMDIKIQHWKANKNSTSINYGPLTFSLKIEEKRVRKESRKSAMWNTRWQNTSITQKWPSWELYSNSKWNFGLEIDKEKPISSFKLIKREWPKNNYPFTASSTPIMLEATGKEIPQWQAEKLGVCGELIQSPVKTNSKSQKIELIPMGAARLRISAFPVVESKNIK
ncbi:hypothetical protein EMN47_07150 [Prolixibacteraceae bacterium JC049]|nr:hypothetical protein [Prolixibacteraceae bacterium JC049]